MSQWLSTTFHAWSEHIDALAGVRPSAKIDIDLGPDPQQPWIDDIKVQLAITFARIWDAHVHDIHVMTDEEFKSEDDDEESP